MDALLWECRRRHRARVRGLPPVVRVHGFGIEVGNDGWIIEIVVGYVSLMDQEENVMIRGERKKLDHPPREREPQEERLELQPEFDRRLAGSIEAAGRTGELNFMMEGLTYFPMGVFQEEVDGEQRMLPLSPTPVPNKPWPSTHTKPGKNFCKMQT